MTHFVDDALAELRPDVILVYGDLPASEIGAYVSLHRRVPLVHIESGYRSSDISDPEERTRILLDHVSRRRITFSTKMNRNLTNEGIGPDSIAQFGDPSLQTLNRRLQGIESPWELVATGAFGLVTLHHHENLADGERIRTIIRQIQDLSLDFPVTFVLYERTREALLKHGLLKLLLDSSIRVVRTLSYDDYVKVLVNSAFVVTDSSGLQDECAFLQKPCIVLRKATPRVEKIGKLLSLVDHSRPNALERAVRSMIPEGGWRGPDLAYLGKPYDGSFLKLLASIT